MGIRPIGSQERASDVGKAIQLECLAMKSISQPLWLHSEQVDARNMGNALKHTWYFVPDVGLGDCAIQPPLQI